METTREERAALKPMEGFCLCTEQGMVACYRSAEDVINRKVRGAFVECGVAWGGMAACMAAAMQAHADRRKFHLFDSFFDGLPMAGPRDRTQPGAWGKVTDDKASQRDRLRPSGVGPAVPLKEVKRHMVELYGVGDIAWQYHAGWFQDTLPKDSKVIGPIALLHLDGDLYESTLVCLEHLYPLVSKGGLVIIDDYELDGCREAVADYFKSYPPSLIPWADYGSVYMVKQ